MDAHAGAIVPAATDPGRRRGRPPRLTSYDRVMLTLTVLRTGLTEWAVAAVFDISRVSTHRGIRAVPPAIAQHSQPATPGRRSS